MEVKDKILYFKKSCGTRVSDFSKRYVITVKEGEV